MTCVTKSLSPPPIFQSGWDSGEALAVTLSLSLSWVPVRVLGVTTPSTG